MRKLTLPILVVLGVFLLFEQSYAAVPLLRDFFGAIPAPVAGFFHKLQEFNFGANLDFSGGSILDIIWSVTLGFIKGVGSIFVWMFRVIASGLEYLIFSP